LNSRSILRHPQQQQHQLKYRPSSSSLASAVAPIRDDETIITTSSSSLPPALAEELQIDTTLIQSKQYRERILEETAILLDRKKYPPGSLPINDNHHNNDPKFTSSWLFLLTSWSKTRCPTGAKTAERILLRLEEEELERKRRRQQQQQTDSDKEEKGGIQLHLAHYAVVLSAWAKSGHFQSGYQAERVLKHLHERAKQLPRLRPTRVALNCMIHAWSNQADAIDRAEATLRQMIDDESIQVEIADYNALLMAYARRGDARQAEKILKEMLDGGLRPDLISYNCVLDAWSKYVLEDHEDGCVERAESILKTMQDRYDRGESTIQPNCKSYSSVATAYVKAGGKNHGVDAVSNVERLLSVAEERCISNDVFLYNSILGAWANSNREDAAEQAEHILRTKMEVSGCVDTVSYNTVIKAWKLSSGVPNAAERAEKLMNHMIELQRSDPTFSIKPDVYTITSIIDCYAKQHQTKGNAKKAVALLQKMIQTCKAGDVTVKPNTITVNCVLDALAKSNEPGEAEEAEALLRSLQNSCEMCLDKVHLNTISYTSVMDAYARNSNPQKTEAIFQLMKEDVENGNSEAKPTTRTYNVILNAWVQSNTREGLERAEAILKRMKNSKEADLRPNIVSYATLMNGWAKSSRPDALLKVEQLFTDITEKSGLKPNCHCYSAYLQTLVRSGERDAPRRADKMIREMYKDYRLNNNVEAKPKAEGITLVIGSWAKSGARDAGERAEHLLNWMLDIYEKEKDEAFKPSQLTFSAVINAWAKCKHFDKAIRARAVLDKMIEMYESGNSDAKPNTIVYTAVLNACAYTIGDSSAKLESFQMATDAFKELCRSRYGNPNHVTYGTFLTACRNLVPEGDSRASTVKAVFNKCCLDGQVSDLVMKRAQSALTNEQFESLLEGHDFIINVDGTVDMESIPDKWKANAVDVRRGRKQQMPYKTGQRP